MAQMVLWVFGTTFALTLMIVCTAVDYKWAQLGLSTVVAAAMVVTAIRHFTIYRAAQTHPGVQAAVVTRYMGLLWAWATVSLVLLYVCLLNIGLMIGSLLIMTFGSALTLLLISKILDRDAIDAEVDPNTMLLVRLIARMQFVATCVAIGALIAYGKLSSGVSGDAVIWAAVNVLLTTAIALASLSAFYLAFVDSAPQPSASSTVQTSAQAPRGLAPVTTAAPRVVPKGSAPRPLRKASAVRLRTA
jgi:hypothetical protein